MKQTNAIADPVKDEFSLIALNVKEKNLNDFLFDLQLQSHGQRLVVWKKRPAMHRSMQSLGAFAALEACQILSKRATTMKHNLQEIRATLQDAVVQLVPNESTTKMISADDIWNELDGLEKELREMYAHQKVIYKIPTVAIKEILGEASCGQEDSRGG